MAPKVIQKGQKDQWKKGESVWVYTTEIRNVNQNDGHTVYIAVQDHRHGCFRPRIGLSEGWAPATVAEDFDRSKFDPRKVADTGVQFVYEWPHWFNPRGKYYDKDQGELMYHARPHLVHARKLPVPKSMPLTTFVRGTSDDYVPELSIIAFRWGGEDPCGGDPGELLGINNAYLHKLIDIGLRPLLDTDYEIWSVFLEDRSDCQKLADTMHLIFGDNHPARRARNVAAMFFLQPTGFDTKSEPARMTGEEEGAGSIEAESLFNLMRATERCGIPIRFPHSSHLYDILTSKTWTHQLCNNPVYRIPATILVPRSAIERNLQIAVVNAKKMLQFVKNQQAALGMCYPQDIKHGVAKLGYSWEALDVKMWKNTKYDLKKALLDLCKHINITGNLVGQAHVLDHVMVQEFIPNTFEMRLYYVENVCDSIMFTTFGQVKENNEFGDFHHHGYDEVLARFMANDRETLDRAIEMGKETGTKLLDWVRQQSMEDVIPAIRFDFFIHYHNPSERVPQGVPTLPISIGHQKANISTNEQINSAIQATLAGSGGQGGEGVNNGSISANGSVGSPGTVHDNLPLPSTKWKNPRNESILTLYTLEICELGFSCLQNFDLPKKVMPAIVRSCIDQPSPVAGPKQAW